MSNVDGVFNLWAEWRAAPQMYGPEGRSEELVFFLKREKMSSERTRAKEKDDN
jgi:hypothetical protein